MSEAKKPKMPFADAKKFRLTFGKHKLKTIDQIAESDAGLKYLDWLRGSLNERCLDWQTYTLDALDAYLSDPTIARELGKVGTTWGQDQNARDKGW
jgi:hypothetical protein